MKEIILEIKSREWQLLALYDNEREELEITEKYGSSQGLTFHIVEVKNMFSDLINYCINAWDKNNPYGATVSVNPTDYEHLLEIVENSNFKINGFTFKLLSECKKCKSVYDKKDELSDNIKVLDDPQNCHEISVDFDGFNYLVVFGTHANGGFFIITNHGVCGELAKLDDVYWNTESIGRALEDDCTAGEVIAKAIAQVAKQKKI